MRISTTIKTLTLSAACLFAFDAYSQGNPVKKFGKPVSGEVVRCATTEYESLLQKRNPQRPNQQQFEEWLAPKITAEKARRQQNRNTNVVVTIPVVVHVIHNGDPIGTDENIADGQILSQITTLNQDFRKMVGTPGHNTHPAGADMEIEFCMAQRDPNGVSSNGIVRYALGSGQGWEMEEMEVLKTQTQWDPEQYLNIWIVDEIYIGGFLQLSGYAQFPTQSGLPGIDGLGEVTTANTDGVVIAANCFGSADIFPGGNYAPNKDMGRTASHEIGHFFGLRHIWGDAEDCSGSDFCADTPAAAGPNQGCPTGTNSCPGQGNDMIENYMDYTDDACLNIFTQNQKDRMMAVLANSPRRASLITSPACTPGVTLENDGALNIQGINIQCGYTFEPQLVFTNVGNNTITAATIIYHIDDQPESTINWEGSLAAGEDTIIQLPELSATSGDHTFNVAITSINGAADDGPLNDTRSQDFNILAAFDTAQVVITIRTDNYGGETIWALTDINEEPIASNIDMNTGFWEELNDNQTYTMTVNVENDECYIFGIIDIAADGICCEWGNGYYEVRTAEGVLIAQGGNFTQMEMIPFMINQNLGVNDVAGQLESIKLYPNPASSTITLTMPDAAALPEGYTVYNSLGQVTGSGKISSSTQSLDISGYANGVYFIKIDKGNSSKTLKFIKS